MTSPLFQCNTPIGLTMFEVFLELNFIARKLTTCRSFSLMQGLSQELETGCLKLAIVKYLGVQFFKGDPNILRFQP